jgi:DNA polymerase elongation subunit (family B)
MTKEKLQELVDSKEYEAIKSGIERGDVFIVNCIENDDPVRKFLTKEEHDNYLEHKRLTGIYDTIQYSTKILLNSLYGAISTPYCRFYDQSLGRSVTLSGQTVIKNNGDMLNDYFNKDIFEHKVVKENFTINHDIGDCDVMTYTDTDSIFSDGKIQTNLGVFKIGTLFDLFNTGHKTHKSQNGHEIIDTSDENLNCMTFNEDKKVAEMGKVKKIIRHKVTKKRWTIKANGKIIKVTNDHSCMVVRNGKLVEVKASDIKKTDKLLILSK